MLETAFTYCCLITVLLAVTGRQINSAERRTVLYLIGIAAALLAIFGIFLLAKRQW